MNNKFFAIGPHTYININFIEEIWTDQNKIIMHDGTTHVFNDKLFDELMNVIKPTMFGSESEFNYESKNRFMDSANWEVAYSDELIKRLKKGKNDN